MNDLRRVLLWISTLVLLAVGVWGLQWHENSSVRPLSVEYRWFRLTHRVELFGRPFYLPWRRMICAWGAIACAAAGLWPLATGDRSRRWLGRWERGGGPAHNPSRR